MVTCQNQVAAEHAFPDGPNPVSDRRMTLTIPCHDEAGYSSSLRGVGRGRQRDGATAKTFYLCENHATLYAQIDKELVEDGWAPCQTARPQRLE
jgi:hypothetical protein